MSSKSCTQRARYFINVTEWLSNDITVPVNIKSGILRKKKKERQEKHLK